MSIQPTAAPIAFDAVTPSDRSGAAVAKATSAAATPEVVGTKNANGEAGPAPTSEAVHQATDRVRKFLEAEGGKDLAFSVDQDTGKTVVKVIDRETKELVRQIPAEEMLQIAKALDKLQGLFLKQQA